MADEKGVDALDAFGKGEAKNVIRTTEAGDVTLKPNGFTVTTDEHPGFVGAIDPKFFEGGAFMDAVGIVANKGTVIEQG